MFKFYNKKKKGFTPTPEQGRGAGSAKDDEVSPCLVWGFTLIEVVITIFVVTVGVLSAFAVTQQIIYYTYQSASRLTAAYLAKEGIEIVRNIRDTNLVESAPSWNDGLVCGSPLCDYEADYTSQGLSAWAGRYLNIDANGFYGYGISDTPTKYKRQITIGVSGLPDFIEVSVSVKWTEKGAPHTITARENLYNWYNW